MIPRERLKKIRRIEIRTRRAVSDLFAGRYHSVFKGQGMEFQEVREYQEGDDVRSIDWNVTARTGTPFVKKFKEERELTVMLLVDISGSNLVGSRQLKRDMAAETAALLAYAAIANQDRVGLILFSDRVEKHVPAGKGPTHVLRVISEILGAKGESAKTDLRPALEYLNRVVRRRAVVFVVSDFLAPGCENLIRTTARKHDLIAVVTGDRLESALPPAGLVEFEDRESGERVVVDTSWGPTRRALAARETARRAALSEMLRGAGADEVDLYAGEATDRELVRFFKAREARR